MIHLSPTTVCRFEWYKLTLTINSPTAIFSNTIRKSNNAILIDSITITYQSSSLKSIRSAKDKYYHHFHRLRLHQFDSNNNNDASGSSSSSSSSRCGGSDKFGSSIINPHQLRRFNSAFSIMLNIITINFIFRILKNSSGGSGSIIITFIVLINNSHRLRRFE